MLWKWPDFKSDQTYLFTQDKINNIKLIVHHRFILICVTWSYGQILPVEQRPRSPIRKKTTTPSCGDAPCSQPITALRVVLEEVATLFWTFRGHVEDRGNSSALRLRLHVLLRRSLRDARKKTSPRRCRDVRGEPDHPEPGHPGRAAGRHPRLRAHAPGLLHDSRRDYVQHDARR